MNVIDTEAAEKGREYARTYYRSHREHCRDKDKKWWAENRTEYNEVRRERGLEYRRGVKLDLLKHYSSGTMECAICGFSDIKALSIDHMNGGGAAHRREVGQGINFYRWLRKHGYPEGYQVLCMNCQWVKRYDRNGYRYLGVGEGSTTTQGN